MELNNNVNDAKESTFNTTANIDNLNIPIPGPPSNNSGLKFKKRKTFILVLLVSVFAIWLIKNFSQKQNNSTKVGSPAFTSDSANNAAKEDISFSTKPQNDYNATQVSFVQKQQTRSSPIKYNTVSVNTNVPSIKNRVIPANEISFIVLNNMVLLRSSLNALEKANWPMNGDYAKPINITYKDLDLSVDQLREVIVVEKAKAQERELPPELESLYTSAAASRELNALTKKAYAEYLSYLQAVGVNSIYIDEMQNIVPNTNERIYFIDNLQIPSSSFAMQDSSGAVEDYSKRVIEITSGSLFNNTKFLYNSRVLGEVPTNSTDLNFYYKELRDMALRLSVYHEATHVLQRAYMTVHAPIEARKGQHIYLDANKTLMDLDKADKWQWSKYPREKEFEELTRTQESQADGIAFEVLTNVYDMNTKQRDALWTHFFSRLDPTWEIIQDIKVLFEQNWPDMSYKVGIGGSLDDALFNSFPGSLEDKTVLKQTLRSSSSLDKDAGYNDPLRPEETYAFWELLKVFE
ncbi:MAG: hypothetical protein ACOZAO_02375 [Patescibacteria group bacterium]